MELTKHREWIDRDCDNLVASESNASAEVTRVADADEIKCFDMKEKYDVSPGQSWGSLPQELQG